MKKATKIIIGTVVTLSIIAGTGAYAGKKFMGKMNGDYVIQKLDKKLDLSDTQVDRLKDIQSYVMSHHKDKKQHRAKSKAKLITLLSSPSLDQAQVLAILDEKLQTIRAEAPTAISKIADFSDTLTETQRAELLEMIESHDHGRDMAVMKADGKVIMTNYSLQ